MLKERLREYIRQKQDFDTGILSYIPFGEALPSLSKYVPGLIRGTYYSITSFANVGKTPLAKFMFVRIPFYYYRTKGIKLKIMYFCLEETGSQFIDSFVSAELYKKHGVLIDYNQLNSYGKSLDSDILDKIKNLNSYFSELEKVLTVVHTATTPEDIIRHINRYAVANGKFFYKETEVTLDDEYTHYVPNDPEEFVIIVVDHINLLLGHLPNDTTFKSIERFSKEYMLGKCIKTYNYIVCAVHQQASEGENVEHSKLRNNEASLATLGDCKLPQRDYLVVFGLNMPQRYGISEHRGYKLTEFGDSRDRYRSIQILKNRFGRSQVYKGMWFTPEAGYFEELPLPNEINYESYVSAPKQTKSNTNYATK